MLLFISFTNFVDGCLQAWYERLLEEGVLYLWGSPVLAEQNLEVYSAQSETFCFIICKMNNIPEYKSEINEVHAKCI